MLHKVALLVCIVCVVGIASLSISCGGSSSSGAKVCTGGPYNVVGDWQITVSNSSGSTVSGPGVISSSGLALFFDTSAVTGGTGDTLEPPALTGACSFSGKIIAYAEPGSVASGGTSVITDSAQGNVNSTSSITGTFSGVSSGSFSVAPNTPLTGSVTALSGAMLGEVAGSINGQPVQMPLTFSKSGSNNSMIFSGSVGSSCNVKGTFSEEGSNNVFDVSITFSGTGCPVSGGMNGLGFESSTDYFTMNGGAQGTYLYADILASGSPFVVEIFQQ